MNWSLKNEIMVKVGAAVAVVLVVVSVVTIYGFRQEQITRIKREITGNTQNIALEIKDKNQNIVDVIQVMANQQVTGSYGQSRTSVNFLKQVLQDRPDILGTYFIYEASKKDENYSADLGKGYSSSGRFAPYWHRMEGELKLDSVTGIEGSNFYQQPKQTREVSITEPYAYQGQMMTSFTAPIVIDGRFKGVAGIDYSLQYFQNVLASLHPFDTVEYYLLSGNNKIIAASEGKKFLNQPLSKFAKYNKAFKSLTDAEEVQVTLNSQLNKFIAFAPIKVGNWQILMTVNKGEVMQPVNQATRRIVILGLVGLVIVSGLIYWLIFRSLKPLQELQGKVEEIANKGGDLTQRLEVKSDNEIGQLAASFNHLLASLQEIIQDIIEETEEVASASQQLSAVAEEGNAVVDTTTENIQDMSSGIQQISASSQEVNASAQETSQAAQEGRENIDQVREQFKIIERVVKESTDNMDQLNSKTEEITEIIELITDIAEQTNLLALNASIEAARAQNGAENNRTDAGQGFAVVAEEIKELAEETNEATDKITQLIEEVQDQSDQVLARIEEGRSEVEKGQELVNQAETSFTDIREEIEATTTQIEETSAAAQQLASNSDEIVNATEEIEEVVEEVTNSATSLAENSEQLQEIVNQFKVTENAEDKKNKN